MDGVLDFLILDSIFKSSIAKNWEIGEAFQSLIDGSNWKGTVLERTPFRLVCELHMYTARWTQVFMYSVECTNLMLRICY